MPSEAHEQLAQLFAENPTPNDAPMADRRAGFDEFLLSMPIGDDVQVTSVDAGGVPLDWITTPGAPEERVIFVVHGGGGCIGSATGYREFASRLSRAARARVAVPDYRLAPEAPFPAGMDDLATAYRWLLGIGVASRGVAVVADSGGVGMALSLVHRVREEGLEGPAAFVGFAPWIDIAVGDTIADSEDVDDPMVTREAMTLFASLYLDGHSPTDPKVNALYADPRGLPPLLFLAATRDIGYRDALHMAERVRAVGVSATVKTFHGMIHNWQMASHLPEATDAVEAAARFVDEHLLVEAAAA